MFDNDDFIEGMGCLGVIVMAAPKHKNFKKEKKHRKNMWCPFCKEERRFILDEVTKVNY